ncbi:DUF559 domain-containing protein [Bradyrhizobium sp. NAS80.1]|uniref:endonuclease domain-containing protein n=1 Tax=Bradyrhizobium sp. NAS80.1 TaxID=1680159 RepID=UPI000AFC7646|nr:DUF559 domain-containing protein [Bradyrhizobium sp. NAS80.1]
MPHDEVSEIQRHRAKRLRREMTRAERLLWRYLKADRLAGLAFRRQTPMGHYIADFVAHSSKLIVELDGESHDFEERIRHDERRDQWFASRGYRVLRFTNDDVTKKSRGRCSFNYRGSGARGTPLPNPPPQGGREPFQRRVPNSRRYFPFCFSTD